MGKDGQLEPVEGSERRTLQERALRIAVSAVGLALVLTAVLLVLTPR